MPSAGIMASGVHLAAPACTDVLTEDFTSVSEWSATGITSVAGGRTGNAGSISGSSTSQFTIPALNEGATVTLGFAFKTSTLAAARTFLQLASDAGATNHTTVQANIDGSVVVRLGGTAGTALGTTTVGLIAANVWNYVEIQVTLHDTAGSMKFRLNGTELLSVGPVDTKLSGTKTVFDTIRLSGGGSGATAMYDDLYLSTGASCAFKGDPNLPPACTDVLTEPFNNFTDNAWDIAGAATIVAGRTGTAAQVSGGVSARATYTIAAPKQSDVITVGMAFRWTDASSLVRAITYLYGNGVTQVHVGLRVETTGALTVTRSTSTALVTSAAGIMVSNTWYYVEIQTKAHATAGTAIVRVNGTEVINATGLNTYTPTGPVLFDGVRVAPNVSGSVHLYDDLYISTGAGCAFKGSITVP
jgi:hypothetical protein